MSSLKDYQVLSTVGSGAFGKCQKIRRHSDGKILVWKEVSTLNTMPREQEKLVGEVNLLRELDHQNIVQYHHHFVDHKRNKVYIMMEYCKGGDLSRVIRGCIKARTFLAEEFILQVLVQLASALKYCHRRPDGSVVLHQDLKPANVFLDQDLNVKLGDFGLAEILPTQNHFSRSKAGTPLYMCPEKMRRKSYNEKSDIWSLGCVIYELCALKPPFTAGGGKTLIGSISSGEFERIPSHYSYGLKSLIRNMLQVSDVLRPSADEILRSHPLNGMVTEGKDKSRHPDHPLPPAMSSTHLRPRAQERQMPKKQNVEYERGLQSKLRLEWWSSDYQASFPSPGGVPRKSTRTHWIFWPDVTLMWSVVEKLYCMSKKLFAVAFSTLQLEQTH